MGPVGFRTLHNRGKKYPEYNSLKTVQEEAQLHWRHFGAKTAGKCPTQQRQDFAWFHRAGNTEGGSIIVPLTSVALVWISLF